MSREDTVRDAFALIRAVQCADRAGERAILDNCKTRAVALYLARLCAIQLRDLATQDGVPLAEFMTAARERNVRVADSARRPRF
jgi:hypothetical protein